VNNGNDKSSGQSDFGVYACKYVRDNCFNLALDWSRTFVRGDVVGVPLLGTMNETWIQAFARVDEEWTRDALPGLRSNGLGHYRWHEVWIWDDVLMVRTDPDTCSGALATYLQALIDKVNNTATDLDLFQEAYVLNCGSPLWHARAIAEELCELPKRLSRPNEADRQVGEQESHT
jgi:hypothetical protein